MAFGGSFASSLDYSVPSLGVSSLAGQHGGGAPAPQAAAPGFDLGQLAHSVVGFAGSAAHALWSPIAQAGATIATLPHAIDAAGIAAGSMLRGEHGATLAASKQAALDQINKTPFSSSFGKTVKASNAIPVAKQFGGIAGTTADNVLTAATLGAGTLEKAGATEAGNIAQKAGQAIVDNAKNLIGAVRTGNVVSQAVKGAATNAALVQPTAQFAGKTAQDLANGDVKNAAIDAALWGLPGAAGIVGKGIKALAGTADTALFGKSAILNQMFGADAVKQFESAGGNMDTLKQIEQFTLNQKSVGGDINKAAPWLKNYIENKIPGIGQGADGLRALAQNFEPYAKQLTTLQKLQDAGKSITPDASWSSTGNELSAKAVTVSHNFVDNIPIVKEAISSAINDPQWNNMQFRIQAVKGVMAKLGIADDTLNRNITDNLLNSNTVEDAHAALDNLVHDSQKYIVKDLGNGFVYTSAPKGVARMPSASEVAGSSLAQGQAPGAVAGKVGKAITAAGLSPHSAAPGALQTSIRDNLGKRFTAAGISADPAKVIAALETKAATVPGASDIRMLSAKQVQSAVSGSDELRNMPPGIIAKAVKGAYKDVPAALTGIGPKVTNIALSVPVAGSALSKYLQIQGLVKYELNPLFYGAKVPIKGILVAGAHGATPDAVIKATFGMSKDTEAALRNDTEGKWLNGGHSGGSGNVADELGGASSTSTQVNSALKGQIVGLFDSVAKAHGTTPQAIIDEKGALYNELKQGASLIKGYGEGGYLNSPLAKTLNLVIFPSRFDTKVVMAAGHLMSHMSPLQQIAVVHGVAQLKGFLDSPQGQQWQKDNSEAIGVLKYFTPIDTLTGVQNFLFKGQHLQDLGQVGGLPFGVISTIITHQLPSVGKFGASQGFDGQGKPYTSAIPTTNIARAQTAFADLLSSMFAWPGKTAGLTSKTKLVQDAGGVLTTPAKTDVQYRYANGALEGSAGAPQPRGIEPAPIKPSTVPKITPQSIPKTNMTAPTTGSSSRGASIKRAKVKSVPIAQQLPGSSAF